MTRRLSALLIAGQLVLAGRASAQQQADTSFQAVVTNPTFAAGAGPVVRIDEAHHNFHTLDGRYQPLARVLRADGYVVQPSPEPFTPDVLAKADVLVISNALHASNVGNWQLPTPSAFTDAEIEAVRAWVDDGGALLLIADHMPFPGAAEKLAATFGFRFNNGFAMDSLRQPDPDLFRRADGTLRDHPITRGRTPAERIDSVRTFTGQAFQADPDVQPLLVFGDEMISLMPEVAWTFDAETPRVPVGGWYQGAVRTYGAGRIAVFGEAAQFTAQYIPQNKVWFGMSADGAEQNQQFLLNVLHWLTDPWE